MADVPSQRVAVFQVIESLAAGGAERMAVEIANRLDPTRFASHIVCTHGDGPLSALVEPHVAVYHLRRYSRTDFSSIRRFAQYASAANVQIVHSHGHFTAYFCGLVKLLTGARWRHVFHDHNVLPGQGLLLSLGDRLFLRKLDAYLVVNEQLRERAVRLGLVRQSRCFRVPNGIPIRHRLEPRTPRADGPPTIVQVANLREVKDQLTAVRVAAQLKRRNLAFRWLMIGSTTSAPDYAARVVEEARELGVLDRVEFPGARRDMEDLLFAATIGVLSSRAEGLPLALLEYLAAGLPVVATDVGYCRQIVGEAEAGFVVPPGDAEGMADRIAWLLEHPAAAAEMGSRGRELVLSRYTIEHTVEAVERTYELLITGASKSPQPFPPAREERSLRGQTPPHARQSVPPP